jgi:hypothetical protein
MKAILEFDLPDDADDFKMASNALNWYITCWDLDQALRAKTKYAPDNLSQDKYDAYQEVREMLREFMADRSLSFD